MTQSAAGDVAPGRRRRWRPTVSVRVRVLTSVLVMVLLGVLLAGGVVYLVQHRSISASVTASLHQEVAEFRTLASTGLDPQTGERFASIERLLLVALQRNVPDRYETYGAFLDGAPLAVSDGPRPLEIESEQAVLDLVREHALDGDVIITDVPTSAGVARVAVVPVSVAGEQDRGVLVMAHVLASEIADLQHLARIYALVSLGALILVGIVGWQVAGRLLRPLRVLRESAERIGASDLSERIPVRGNDDVSELTRTYNDMLDRLKEAIDTQRRFLDDAGHELRTPITVVRGHLELLDPNDPADVIETRALLLDEIDRMSRMVQDLILLSKAQRPDFVVTQEVDLGILTDDVFERARMLGDRHWAVAARAEGVCRLDPGRLTQAMLELATNAVKFSDPGSTVALGSSWEAGVVRLWVADQGRGIPAEDLEHVFDRFSRGRASQRIEGSGLGLAIVESIAVAHGGLVRVESVLGSGSVFVLELPAVQPPVDLLPELLAGEPPSDDTQRTDPSVRSPVP